MRRRILYCAVLAAPLALAGCERVAPPLPDGNTVTFSEGGLAEFDPSAALTPLRDAALQLREDQDAVIASIAEHPEAFLAGAPPTEVLNEAELVFFGAGRLFELAGWYADAVERGQTELRPRVAWAYERVGLHNEALEQARLAVDERPNDAQAWFVLGFVLGQAESADDVLLTTIRDAFAKAIELDPRFVGPSGVTANDLRQQVMEIDRALVGVATPRPNPHQSGQ